MLNAVTSGKPNLVKENLNGDLEESDKSGNTPLIISAFLGNTYNVKLLVEAGANIHAKNKEGYTPLTAASLGKRWNVVSYLSRILEERYVPRDINLTYEDMKKTIYFMNDRNMSGDSFLIKAAEEGNYVVAKTLIAFGVDVHEKGLEDHTPLIEAKMWKREKIRKLIESI
jgi:ankyrin repeat protein